MKSLRKSLAASLVAGLLLVGLAGTSNAQVNSQVPVEPAVVSHKKAGGAFLRSIVFPGWGHRYVQDDWRRGRLHAGADVTFLAAALGYNQQANNTRDAMYTAAHQLAGVDIKGRNKAFQLAVAQYNSLEEYNKSMEQTRNWDRFYEVTPENNWDWRSEEDRIRYNNLRGRSDDSRRQAGIFVGLLAVNRVVSGISSMVSARNHNRNIPNVVIVPDFSGESAGVAAHLSIRF